MTNNIRVKYNFNPSSLAQRSRPLLRVEVKVDFLDILLQGNGIELPVRKGLQQLPDGFGVPRFRLQYLNLLKHLYALYQLFRNGRKIRSLDKPCTYHLPPKYGNGCPCWDTPPNCCTPTADSRPIHAPPLSDRKWKPQRVARS